MKSSWFLILPILFFSISSPAQGPSKKEIEQIVRDANQGNPKAQLYLGSMYGNGKGVPLDHAEAAKWYRKAAEQGYAKAQWYLGLEYYHGAAGLPRDYAEAAKWQRKAADQGLAEAQIELGNMYYRGEGVPQDLAEAEKWYRKAADQGNAKAKDYLQRTLGVRETKSKGQLTAQGDPLSKLVGDWGLTVFVIGGGQFGGPRCGKSDRPGSSPVTLAPPGDSGVSLAVACNDGSDYAFRLKHGTAAHAYLITVKSKQGISVNDFPVAYVEGQGWKGAREQMVEGKKVSITATVAPIAGRNWYGWMIAVLPTADIRPDDINIKTPYFRADLTRRK